MIAYLNNYTYICPTELVIILENLKKKQNGR